MKRKMGLLLAVLVLLFQPLVGASVVVAEESQESFIIEEKESTSSSTADSTQSETTQSTTEEEAELTSEPEEIKKEEAVLSYRSFNESNEWGEFVNTGELTGQVGQGNRIKGLELNLENGDFTGEIQYRSHVSYKGWMEYVKSGEVSGEIEKKNFIEAIEIQLTDELADAYDIYYRVYSNQIGWLSWAKNGESAGTSGYGNPAEAIEIRLQKKGEEFIEDRTKPFDKKTTVEIEYSAHVQNLGWQPAVKNGVIAGTTGKTKNLEAAKILLKTNGVEGGISYRSHVSNIGWQKKMENGNVTGTTGQNKPIEAMEIELTGEAAELYDLYYRVHAQNFGWLDWAKNGQQAGTTGFGFSAEAFQIEIVKKGEAAPGLTTRPFINYTKSNVQYATHVSNVGWQNLVNEGELSGTVGQFKRLEAIKINIEKAAHLSGDIQYKTHVQNIGWQNWVKNGALAGTTGQAKRLEAIQIKLTGDLATSYDIYYRVHAQNFGWLSWAKNGQSAGTAGFSYRLEAIQIKLVKKNTRAPGATNKPFIQADKAMEKVQKLLNQRYRSNSFGIYVKSLSTNEVAQVNGNTIFTAASTGKLPIIYWTQKRINDKTINKHTKFQYKDAINKFPLAYQSGGAGVLQNRPYGGFYSVDQILHETIRYSDNQGTNFLAYYVGNQYDAKFKREISSIIGRDWQQPFSITARENAALIEKIYRLGGEANHYLKDTVYDNQRIPKYLPVPVGHKIGDVYDCRHDVAIVYANKPYILSVMTKNYVSYETISRMSKDIYDILK